MIATKTIVIVPRLFLFLFLLIPVNVQAQTLGITPDDGEEAMPEVIAVEPVPDSTLAARMRGVFAEIDEFDEVQIAVRNNVVRLTGRTLDAEAKERAAALARRFEGVLFVDNDIEEATDVETRVTPALARLQSYWDGVVGSLPLVVVAAAVFLFFALLAALVGRWKAPFARFGASQLLQSLIRRILRLVLFALGIVLAFDILGVTALVGAVLGTAGVIGLALGFAFQDIVENYLAGVLMSLRRPFALGDLVEIEGHTGKVTRLTSRELLILTLDGNHVRLPNATVFKSNLVNYTRNPRRRFEVKAGVGVNEDLAQAMEVGLDALRVMPGVLDDPPPFAAVEELGDSSVAVRFFGWVDQRQTDWFKVRSEAVRLVKTALDDAGIEMPEPIYRVLLQSLPETAAASKEVADRPTPETSRAVRDIAPDETIDDQIQEDINASDGQNLLS